MSLNPLANRLHDLPLIICGPIVRRVEPEAVAVWVAIKANRKVELSLWPGVTMVPQSGQYFGNAGAMVSSGKVNTLKVGENLYISLVYVKGLQLLPGQIYSYNLSFFGGTTSEDLSQLGLLQDQEADLTGKPPYFKHLALGYVNRQLPTFVVPADNVQQLQIAHGSCRKDHGQGKDGLAALDEVISRNLHAPENRPQMLFLTGDQIYADALSGHLLPFISDCGNTLIGKTETAPILEDKEGQDDDHIHFYPIDQEHFPAGWRKDFLAKQAFFTGGGQSHLISFGEYCSTYLYYWCNVIWDKELLDFYTWWETVYFPNGDKVKKMTDQVYANQKPQEKLTHEEKHKYVFSIFEAVNAYQSAYSQSGLRPVNSILELIEYKNVGGKRASEVLEEYNEKLKAQQKAIEKKIKKLEKEEKQDANREKEIKDLKSKVTRIEAFLKVEKWVKHVEDLEEWYNNKKPRVANFRENLPKVRRALANTPTMMVFDDHDVTDDWFITGEWRKKTLSMPLGLTVNRNALMAFALFQSMGNKPDYFDFTTKKHAGGKLVAAIPALVDKMPAQAAKASDPFIKQANAIDLLLGLDKVSGSTVEWNFDVKLGPTHVFGLDTRVNRDYSDGDHLPCGLLTSTAIKKQLSFKKIPHDLEFIIVISAVPVLGLSTMEDIGQLVGSRAVDFFSVFGKTKEDEFAFSDLRGRFSLDLESWSFRDQTFEQLLAHLFPRKKILFLSGDVHYGAAASIDYWKKGIPQRARFIQMTSSALRNEKGPSLTNVAMSGFSQQILTEGLDQVYLKRTKYGWSDTKGVAFSKLLPLRWRKIMWKKPVLIPAWQFPKDIRLSKGTEPEWVWQMQAEYDIRPDAERPIGNELTLSEDLPAVPRLADLTPVFQRHIHLMHQRISRRVVFNANVGIVRFERDNNNRLYAIQDFHYYHPNENRIEDPQIYNSFRILFEPTDSDPPTLNQDHDAV